MKITLKTDVIPAAGETKSVAIQLESQEIVNIINTSGVEAANKSIDNLVEKYTSDIKKLLSEVLNK
jgi:hypothetical protein